MKQCTVYYDQQSLKALRKDIFAKSMCAVLFLVSIVFQILTLLVIHQSRQITTFEWIVTIVTVVLGVFMLLVVCVNIFANSQICKKLKNQDYYSHETIRNDDPNDNFMKMYRIFMIGFSVIFTIFTVIFVVLRLKTYFEQSVIDVYPAVCLLLMTTSLTAVFNLSLDKYIENNLRIDFNTTEQ